MSDTTQEEAHTGPIKTPKQLLVAVFFSFFVPVFAIIALVAYVVAETKPAGSTDAHAYALGGLTAQDQDRGIAQRIRKVGMVEIKDPNRPLKAGKEVYEAQCVTCHATGAANAPKLGDAASWANRIKTGFEAMVTSALKGKGAMPAQAGGDFEDTEIARAVAYMANAGGAKFAEPQKPAASVTTAAAPAPAAAATPVAVAGGNGEALYKQACFACHAAGLANAPKLGDKAAWAPRLAMGPAQLTQSVIKGKGAMPAKGGTAASDAELRAAVDYMVSSVK